MRVAATSPVAFFSAERTFALADAGADWAGGGAGEGDGGLLMLSAGAGAGVILEISWPSFLMPGRKTTTSVTVPNAAASAAQRIIGPGLQRHGAATPARSAVASSAGNVRAATSRQSAHWLR